jgi:hypothetical protein
VDGRHRVVSDERRRVRRDWRRTRVAVGIPVALCALAAALSDQIETVLSDTGEAPRANVARGASLVDSCADVRIRSGR